MLSEITDEQRSTLEYAGNCVQARQVGGDYYDFLDLGSSHVAFVLADISGKGIAGALLMANLQANLCGLRLHTDASNEAQGSLITSTGKSAQIESGTRFLLVAQ